MDNLFGGIFKRVRKGVDDIVPTPKKYKGNAFETLDVNKTLIDNKKFIPTETLAIPKKLPSTPDDIAVKIDFKNEAELFDYIKNFDTKKGDYSKFKKLFTLMKKNKSVMKFTGGATAAALLYHYCLLHQRSHSGCFRYLKDKDGNIIEHTKKKIDGSYCIPFSEPKIHKRHHPLYGVEKWDCNFKGFEGPEAKDILKLGCNGLCNVENFNILAGLTKEYEPYTSDKESKHIYKCEIVTILGSLTEMTGDAIDDAIDGALNSKLGKRIKTSFSSIKFYIFVVFLFFIYYHFFCNRHKVPH